MNGKSRMSLLGTAAICAIPSYSKEIRKMSMLEIELGLDDDIMFSVEKLGLKDKIEDIIILAQTAKTSIEVIVKALEKAVDNPPQIVVFDSMSIFPEEEMAIQFQEPLPEVFIGKEQAPWWARKKKQRRR